MLPGWGLSQKLPRLIGLSRAREIAFTGAPVFAQQAYEWGLVNHVVTADELLPRAVKMARGHVRLRAAGPAGVPHLIEDGYSMPYNDALAWETGQSIASARLAAAHMIEARRQGVLAKGRSEKA